MERGMTGTVKFRADTAKQKNEARRKEYLWQDPTAEEKTEENGAGNRVFSPFVTDLKLYI